MTNILITGGTGSLGSALARKWAGEGHRITIISRDDHKQSALRQELPRAIFHSLDLGNADSWRRLLDTVEGQDLCIHAAAQKVVSEGQYQPFAYLYTNVFGTMYLQQAWKHVHGDCHQFLFISSDKAASPLNFYGGTKLIATGLVRAEGYEGSVLRYGNVVTSNGAFIQKWRQALANGESIKLYTPEPTRFFLTMDEAVALVEDVLNRIQRLGGGVFVPHGLRAFRVWDVARAMQARFVTAPLPPFEKRHETLVAEGEGVEQVSDRLSRIVPYWPPDDNFGFLAPFRSNTAPQMTGQEVLKVLGWNK